MSNAPLPIERVRPTAEARLKQREERKSDADKVWVEMAASRTAERAKTDRLRALRLAKEEAERVAAATMKASGVRPKRVSRGKSAAASGPTGGRVGEVGP